MLKGMVENFVQQNKSVDEWCDFLFSGVLLASLFSLLTDFKSCQLCGLCCAEAIGIVNNFDCRLNVLHCAVPSTPNFGPMEANVPIQIGH
jgi:hypothetical protein